MGATSATKPLCSRLSASKVAQEVAQEHTAMAAVVAVNVNSNVMIVHVYLQRQANKEAVNAGKVIQTCVQHGQRTR